MMDPGRGLSLRGRRPRIYGHGRLSVCNVERISASLDAKLVCDRNIGGSRTVQIVFERLVQVRGVDASCLARDILIRIHVFFRRLHWNDSTTSCDTLVLWRSVFFQEAGETYFRNWEDGLDVGFDYRTRLSVHSTFRYKVLSRACRARLCRFGNSCFGALVQRSL